MAAIEVAVKRVYEKAAPADGMRVLVDRVWPRGLSKSDLEIDAWLRDLAPTKRLREWFGHDPDKWPEFKRRYERELSYKRDLVEDLLKRSKKTRLTLLFSARERRFNNAVALKEFLESSLPGHLPGQ